jgi:aminocarboxymuconate-semialdehyde decarboxylase
MLGSERMPKYWLPWLVAMPRNISRHLFDDFGGVFERFRHCVAFAHAGGAFHLPSVASITHFVCALMWWRRKTAPVRVAISLTTESGAVYVDSLVHDADALMLLPNCSAQTDRMVPITRSH